MDLEPKHYLLIYALIVTPIVISFFFLRKGQSPSRLNLKDGGPETKNQAGIPEPPSKSVAPSSTRAPAERARRFEAGIHENSAPREKALNVLFNWNGHSWDAYEVLGVPAGSSKEAVQAAYQKLMTQGDPASMPFYKAAFDAIIRSAFSA